MLNYANLNDIEFEYLCQDVMESKLGIELRRFAGGRDGGIDIRDAGGKSRIVIQVKHYVKTNVSGLISALKKEVEKVEKLKPSQYYICCSKELSAKRITEIYLMFSKYMDSEKNIITLNEIEDFLTDSSNTNVLRKHYKLWISSSNILQDINNNDIFIDCEYLLSSIDREKKYFVQTDAYNESLKCLSQNNILFLTGDPGVGKTITSKMLILNYAAEGYRVRYTTDVTNIASLKKSISQNKDSKEVILLDDCFGQAYFDMKLSQGTELLSLIRYINFSENKLLILNSRITIYQEAKIKTPELVNSFENKEFKVKIIDMSAISSLEKAEILYNYMYYNTKDEKYFQEIKKDKKYWNIINHKNYNPRIIEFISNKNRYKGVPPEKYYEFVIECLNNPHMIWDNEYEERIKSVDRCLLMTLYSISDTIVSYELAKQCFNKRIQCISSIDTTINQFERSIERLQESFIRLIDDNGDKKISMINPSVNDYLNMKIKDNPLEKENIIRSAMTIIQYKRILTTKEADEKIDSFFKTGRIKEMLFETDKEKNGYITAYVALNLITCKSYTENIYSYLRNIDEVYNYAKDLIYPREILINFFSDNLYYYYNIDVFFRDTKNLMNIFWKLELKEVVKIILKLYEYYEEVEEFIYIFKKMIYEKINSYYKLVDILDFDLDINLILKEIKKTIEYQESEIDYAYDILYEELEKEIFNIIEKEIDQVIHELPDNLRQDDLLDRDRINIYGIEETINSILYNAQYYCDDYDDSYHVNNTSSYTNYIDSIFNR